MFCDATLRPACDAFSADRPVCMTEDRLMRALRWAKGARRPAKFAGRTARRKRRSGSRLGPQEPENPIKSPFRVERKGPLARVLRVHHRKLGANPRRLAERVRSWANLAGRSCRRAVRIA